MKRQLPLVIISMCTLALYLLLLPMVGQAGSPWTRTFLCKENTVTIIRDAAGTYHFQSTGRIQVDRLSGGSMTQKKGVPVYKFQDAADNTGCGTAPRTRPAKVRWKSMKRTRWYCNWSVPGSLLNHYR